MDMSANLGFSPPLPPTLLSRFFGVVKNVHPTFADRGPTLTDMSLKEVFFTPPLLVPINNYYSYNVNLYFLLIYSKSNTLNSLFPTQAENTIKVIFDIFITVTNSMESAWKKM